MKFCEIQGAAVFNRQGDLEIALPCLGSALPRLGAHAPRVLVSAPRRNQLLSQGVCSLRTCLQRLEEAMTRNKFAMAMAGATSPAREARALPRRRHSRF